MGERHTRFPFPLVREGAELPKAARRLKVRHQTNKLPSPGASLRSAPHSPARGEGTEHADRTSRVIAIESGWKIRYSCTALMSGAACMIRYMMASEGPVPNGAFPPAAKATVTAQVKMSAAVPARPVICSTAPCSKAGLTRPP